MAIARRDAGQPLAAQLLLYPVTDVAGRYTDDEVNAGYMSRASTHKRFGLTLEGMVNFAQHLCRRRPTPRTGGCRRSAPPT